MTEATTFASGIRSGLLATFGSRTSLPSLATAFRSALWPIALMSVINRSYVLATSGGGDYAPVYRAALNFTQGWDIYNEHLEQTDTHYLYPPGSALMFSPFGYLPYVASRNWFIVLTVVTMLLAAYFLLRLFGFSLSSVAAPALVLAMFSTEAVVNTLVYANINGLLLLMAVLFFRWLRDGRTSREWWAGAAIGLTLVSKPLLLPLLLIPVMHGQWPPPAGARPRWMRSVTHYLATSQWRAVAAAVLVPIGFNAVAWPLCAHPMDYVTRTLPYSLSARDHFNSSIQGMGIHYGLPLWLILALRVLFALLAVGSLVLLYRYYRTRDPLFWMLTSSGVLLTASWLVLALGEGYYSMMLFPFLMTFVLPNSVVRNWPAWLGVYGCMTNDNWMVASWPATGRFLHYVKFTYGWSLLLIVTFVELYFRYLDAKAQDRLDCGIDPPRMTQGNDAG
jgi:arabinofuranan 3-O-arabinosyltransferase